MKDTRVSDSSFVHSYDDNDADALGSYKSHIEILKDIRLQHENDGDYEEYYDKLHDMVLSVDEKKVYEICLGTGGPGYHLNVCVSGTGNTAYIESMSYTYLNWFYKKDIPIIKGTDEWNVWEEFASNFVEEWM